jgi:GNAT superfamily N-acetyltransferase
MSKKPIIEAMVANRVEFLRLFGNTAGTEMDMDGDVAWIMTGVPFPLFNSVILTDLKPEAADEAISETLFRFQKRKLPMLWSVDPTSRPDDLGRRLESIGLKPGGESPGMALDLLAISDRGDQPAGLTIRPVIDISDLSAWCDVIAICFQFEGFVRDALFQLMDLVGNDEQSPLRNYIGIFDGEVVASSTVLYGGGVAGIYNVGTMPAARGKGIGRSITLAPLIEARDAGYTIGVLESSPMGLNLYSKLGFKKYCTFSRYIWIPEQ